MGHQPIHTLKSPGAAEAVVWQRSPESQSTLSSVFQKLLFHIRRSRNLGRVSGPLGGVFQLCHVLGVRAWTSHPAACGLAVVAQNWLSGGSAPRARPEADPQVRAG